VLGVTWIPRRHHGIGPVLAAASVSYVIAIACGGKASTQGAAPEAPAVWSFNGNCGDGSAVACGNVVCPSFDGGTAAEPCDPPFASCVNSASEPYANKSFACEPTGHAVWSLNAYCGAPPFTDCAASAFAACAAFDGGGIAGEPCDTPLAECVVGDASVYACVPGGGDFWVFNGYCGEDAGALVQGCPAASGACPEIGEDAGVVGIPCSSPLERCIDVDAKIFVCTPR
jgi:hypothetical protein